MRGTLVFVHGTGVRREGLDKTWESFQEAARAAGLDGVALEMCDWGPTHAPDLAAIDAALPVSTVPDVDVLDESDTAAAWELRIEDPLFELRLIADGPPMSDQVALGGAGPDVHARALVSALANLEETDTDRVLSRCGITADEVREAGATVSASDELGGAAVNAGSEFDGDFLEALARAIVATVLAVHRSDPPGLQPELAVRPSLRTELVELVVRTMFPGDTKAIGGWLAKRVGRFVANRATNFVVPRRERFMDLAGAAFSDILHYQRRGDEIRSYVARSLLARERPLTVVGHSLGGVILVDLLSSEDAPPVDLLVTIGSQAPLFYAIDALASLRPGGRHRPFTPWLNIYNGKDLLSFCAERVFPDEEAIQDFGVDARVPFPEAHSAYWAVDEVFTQIREVMAAVGGEGEEET